MQTEIKLSAATMKRLDALKEQSRLIDLEARSTIQAVLEHEGAEGQWELQGDTLKRKEEAKDDATV